MHQAEWPRKLSWREALRLQAVGPNWALSPSRLPALAALTSLPASSISFCWRFLELGVFLPDFRPPAPVALGAGQSAGPVLFKGLSATTSRHWPRQRWHRRRTAAGHGAGGVIEMLPHHEQRASGGTLDGVLGLGKSGPRRKRTCQRVAAARANEVGSVIVYPRCGVGRRMPHCRRAVWAPRVQRMATTRSRLGLDLSHPRFPQHPSLSAPSPTTDSSVAACARLPASVLARGSGTC